MISHSERVRAIREKIQEAADARAIEDGLAPCPFCGGAARLIRKGLRLPARWVECGACEAHTVAVEDDAQAIAAWERRADKASPEKGAGIGDFSKVTRFEVIDHRTGAEPFGRVYSAWGATVSLSLQDGGRTVKAFVDDAARVVSCEPTPEQQYGHDTIQRGGTP